MSRILVVDDKEENLYLLRALLAGHGHQVTLARNGAEALSRADDDAPDLVISDILMPVMDGFALCRRWKGADSALRHVPFVFYTATYTGPKDEELALALGADRFIVKPAEPAEFLQTITTILEENEKGSLHAGASSPEPEEQYLREYNEVLIHKLEDKLVQLEAANHTLVEKDAFNLAVMDAMPALVAVLGPGGNVVAVNEAWRAFECPRDDHPCWELLRLDVGESAVAALERDRAAMPAIAEELRDAVLEIVRGARSEFAVELPYDDARRWLLVRGEHVGAAGAAAVIACSDITEPKRAAEVTKEASRRKDEFLAMLGHELRNPLGAIRNASFVLSRSNSADPRSARATAVIDRQVGHLARIVDDLLEVSRMARGTLPLQRDTIDWRDVVRETAEDHRAGFEDRGLELTVELPDSPVWVLGDRTRLAQVIAHLLANAQKFTDRGGRAKVRLAADERARVGGLTLEDTGTGMTADVLARVFQPFEQGPQGSARTRGGFGMGLALVKGLVDLHGGEVHAHSEGPGRGSTFRVHLPLIEAAGRHPAPGEQVPPSRALNVLVIEDNHDTADSLRELLEVSGLSVQVVYDGPSGVEAARAHRPQVILCDIGLPGPMDGYQVASAIRADASLRDVRLIALTGYGEEEDRRRSEQAGFDSHVTKPADPSALLGLVADSGAEQRAR